MSAESILQALKRTVESSIKTTNMFQKECENPFHYIEYSAKLSVYWEILKTIDELEEEE